MPRINLRTRKGRPFDWEDPAPTKKRTVMVPAELDDLLGQIAEERGRTLHAEMRAALASWAAAYLSAKSADSEPDAPPKP